MKKEKIASKKEPVKVTQYSCDVDELSNSRSWIDFLDQETLSAFPGRNDWRKRLIYTMLSWSEKKDSLEIMQFCLAFKLPYRTLKESVKRAENKLVECLEELIALERSSDEKQIVLYQSQSNIMATCSA